MSARIMAVDDDPAQRKLLEKRLVPQGYQFFAYSSAQEALAAIPEVKPDLILLDVTMPGMDGTEACRRINEDHPGIPVIFVTALGRPEDRATGFEAGGRDYIAKPFHPTELLMRIQHLLRERAEKEAAERRAESFEIQAITDALTGLANRRYFDLLLPQEVERAMRYGTELSCIMTDIDHFKSINDRYGHATGDEVIRAVAGVIKSGMRATDLAARYGGEEFVVLLPQTSLNDAMVMAERIRVAIEALDLGEGRPKVTNSFGAATGATKDLVENADKALYEAKRKGRNRVERWTGGY